MKNKKKENKKKENKRKEKWNMISNNIYEIISVSEFVINAKWPESINFIP